MVKRWRWQSSRMLKVFKLPRTREKLCDCATNVPPASAPKLFSLQLAVFEVAIISLSPPRPCSESESRPKKRGRWKDVSNHGGSLFFANFAFIVILSSRVGETEGRPLLKMHGLHSYSSWWWHNCFETKKVGDCSRA